ncbi:FAD binding domain-containing protein [Lindgomyces ingoldianus]|uniref:FAD binding domain-containing protein n=1 Tax=Lindgomyces ingoldianus TaxID=673940 RepID=A0ACB6R5E9_9PLEO|nr:FAD binding domain-containing protein [Lindgomyces ingoldianus]KAF2473676.1 FAD binding domain-containing protein [Lindgomyces ingoldianus]
MRVTSFFSSSALGVGTRVLAQSTFEPSGFNVVDTLIDYGINILSIPALEGLVERTPTSACSIAISTISLRIIFGSSKVIIRQSSAYDAFTNAYWSIQQASVDPYCIFKPSKAAEVSILVLLSRLTQCPFAVKSGGHAAFGGASSIQGCITVTLANINDIFLSSDKKTVSLGTGNTWYDVYTNLQSQGDLAVIGGRVAAIGVGGLTLGGGISFFSNTYGWACDNVASFEVVTASGIIVTASPTSYSDLYWALRGGGNNFGIVTKFTLETIAQGQMWGGGRLHIETEFPAVIQAFYNLGNNAAQDTNTAHILSFTYVQSTKFASADLQYAKPVANASILAEYIAIPAVSDTTRIRSLADLTVQFNASNPNGLRQTYWAAAYKLDKDFTTFIKDVFFEYITAIADAPALIPAATLQVISLPMLQKMTAKGGNRLGLSASSGPLLLLNLNMMWSNSADDARILEVNSNIIERTVAEAKKRGLSNEYIYMNYASQFQAVVPSYGATNQQKLKTIANKYDPTAVSQELQPGYFKLDGAPDANIP